MLKIITVPVTPIHQNARVVFCSLTSEAVVVDPGGDARQILSVIHREGLRVKQIWLTHSHFDHCGGVSELLELLVPSSQSIKLLGHQLEKDMRAHVTDIVAAYGLGSFGFRNCPEPDEFLVGGQTVHVAEFEFEVLFTPGHSPGHVCFYCKQESVLLAGDTVFQGSIGRTDLPMGNHRQLLQSIHEKLLILPDHTVVYSGHGENTTIGRERASNPFLQ